MSVHGEYARSLETLIACVRALNRPERADWLRRLEDARVERQPDLSQAAEHARLVLADLERSDCESPRLAEAGAHLRAHCDVILGVGP